MLKNSSFVCLGAKRIFDIPLSFEDDETCRWIDTVDHHVYFTLRKEKNIWYFSEENTLGLCRQRLYWDHSYPIQFQGASCLLYASVNDPVKQRFHYYRMPETAEIIIGRKKGDIRYDHPSVSALHALLTVDHGSCVIEDLNSTNGVYVNQKRELKKTLRLGDCIYIMGLQIVIGHDFLAINQKGEALRIKARLPPYEISDEGPALLREAMLCQAQPQPYVPYETKEYLLKEAPAIVKQERQPLMYLLGPSLTMSAASGFSSLFMVQNLLANHQPLNAAVPSLVMAGSMLIGSLLWPILSRRYEVKKEHSQEQKREACYKAYLSERENEFRQCMAQAALKLKQLYLNDAQAIWPYEFDHMLYVCIGIGDQPFPNPFRANEQPLHTREDPLDAVKHSFLTQAYYLKDVPLIQTVSNVQCFQVSGNDRDRCAYAQWLLYHHVLLYAPSDSHVLIAYTKAEESWLPRFLPHMFHESGYRFLCVSLKQLTKALMYLHQDRLPVLALSFASFFTDFIRQNAFDLSMALFLFHDDETAETLNINDYHGMRHQQEFVFEKVSNFSETMDRLCNIDMHMHKKHFPKQLGFLQMYHVQSLKQLQIEKRWYRDVYEPSLQACLGVRKDGETLCLDLHERYHGPHGIVAGMTGSGKSELLITLLLSLAIHYHPYVCSFILIDYKGGGMAKALAKLPHLAGVITNLDGAMIERSLTSLHVELLRRQQLFAQVMESGGYPSMDIDVYQRLYHEHKVTEIVPHLVIAADEFAELKQQEPQFMEQLIRIARIGRSLGIHLILATQKPSGIVDDQIWSNSRFHICLKVAEKSDSMDMLKREEGAHISAVGRFYLQVGYDEVFAEGQSAYAKLPYDSKQQGLGQTLIKETANDGSVQRTWQRAYSGQIQSELNAIIDHLDKIAAKHQLHVPRLWLDPLPEHIDLTTLTKGCFALVDDPKRQRQFPLSVTDNLCNSLFLGHDINALGKAVHAYLYALCTSESRYRIIIIDAANGKLCEWRKNSRIYAAVTLEESDDLRFIIKQLYALRKKKHKEAWLFIVHHAGVLIDAYEEAREWLITLAKDHGNNGIHVLFSAMSLTDIPARLFQQFENLFVFHLSDEQEARTLVHTAVTAAVPLRAVHKQQDTLYTVQFAECDEIIPSHELLPQLPQLEEEPTYVQLEQEADFGLVIGRSLSTRFVVSIPIQGIWIISGNERRRFYEAMQHIAQMRHLPISFHTDLESDFHNQMHMIALSPQALSMNFHHPLLQDCSLQHHVLWCGLGLSEYRYLWNLDNSFQTDKKADLCWIQEEAVIVRGIYRYE